MFFGVFLCLLKNINDYKLAVYVREFLSLLSLEESNLHNQNQNLVHYHYAKGQSLQRKIGTAKIYIICKRAK